LFASNIPKLLQRIVEGYSGFIKSTFAPITNAQIDAALSNLFGQSQFFKNRRALGD